MPQSSERSHTEDDVRRAEEEFALERARAINAYAELEQSLAGLFRTLLDTDPEKSYVIFSKIINTRSRNEILSELMRIRSGNEYNDFFKSLMRRVTDIDVNRNKIVHWIQRTSVTSRTPFRPGRDISLHKHPNIFDHDKYFKAEIVAFRQKTSFLSLLIYYFDIFLHSGDSMVPGGTRTWSEIFRLPADYPPPRDHPLFHRSTEP